jgi:integrase
MANRKHKARKSYGLGRKFLRGSIWWVAIYDGSNNEIRLSTKSKREADADDLLGQKLRERSRGELVSSSAPVSKLTVAEVLDEYLKRREHLASGTVNTYKSQVNTLLKPYFGLHTPSTITTDMLSDYRDWRSKQKVTLHNGPGGTPTKLNRRISKTSINRELGLLRSALRDLAKRRPNLLANVPYFPMEQERNTRKGFLSERDFTEKLYPQLPRHLKALAACAFFVGGRKEEWLSLDWEEVDLQNLIVRFVKTKNKYPREVPIIHGLMYESLSAALAMRNAAWPEEPAVFMYDGHRMSTVGDAWDKACVRAGHAGLLFHDLRRSANKNMRDRGISQGVRMQIMGHRTASMDLRYGIVDHDDITDARQKLSTGPAKRKGVE